MFNPTKFPFFRVDHLIAGFIYFLFAIAAVLVAWAGPVGAQGMKDPPSWKRPVGYGISVPDEFVARPRLPWRMPLPDKNTVRKLGPVDSAFRYERRVLLVKCAAFYVIFGRNSTTGDAETLKQLSIAALREANRLAPTPAQREAEKDESYFMAVYEDYVMSVERGTDLYDQYGETCNAVVRPLLQIGAD